MNRSRTLAAVVTAALTISAPLVTATAAHGSAADPTGPTMLGANRVAMGHRVPWGQVGHGWYLTVIDEGHQGRYQLRAHHQLLELVDPQGGRYQLVKTRVADDGVTGYRRLMDWSADGRRALVLVGGGTPRARAVEYHLRSGRREVTALGKRISTVTLGPHGSLFATRYGGNGGGLVRLDADGARQLLMAHTDGMPLPSRSGRRIVVASARFHDHTFQVLTDRGALVRNLALPRKCWASRWWSTGVAMARCYTHAGATRLYAVPVDGSAATAITAPHGMRRLSRGDRDARSLDGTTYLEEEGPCGVVFLGRQGSRGSVAQVRVPDSTGNVYLLGTRGRRLVLQTGVACDGGSSRSAITHFDPVTHTDRVVAELPPGEAYGTILAFGERRTSLG